MKKSPPKVQKNDMLTAAAISIGSTLGTLAKKVGLSAPPAKVKKAVSKKSPAKKKVAAKKAASTKKPVKKPGLTKRVVKK